MFKIPEWSDDVPRSNVTFNKLGKKKLKELSGKSLSIASKAVKKAAMLNEKANSKPSKFNKKEKPISKPSPLLGNPPLKSKLKQSKRKSMLSNKIAQEEPRKMVVKSSKIEKSTNKSSAKKVKNSPPKLKTNSADNIDLADLNTDTLDEVLLNAKKRKFCEVYQKYDSEDALFTAQQKSKKTKPNKPDQKKESQTKPVNNNNIPNKINGDSTKNKNNLPKQIAVKQDKKKEKLKMLLASNRTPITVKGNNLRERMLERLKAAQFRYLNEKLYTSSASDAQQLFQSDPMAFETYHQGYQLQVKKWPVKPLDVIVKKIVKMPKSHLIADMGCGEATLSKLVPQKVRSFDLVATAPGVEACDMAHTPLLSESVDVAVYCLALMGTDLTQYLCEANRVLKNGGHLLIAEVESRFDKVEDFIDQVQKLGFKLKNLDKSNTVFFFIEFTKVREPPAKKSKLPSLHLKPCLYKKR